MTMLLGDDNEEVGFKINEKYASKYQEKKKKEEISILEDKYKERLAKKGARPTFRDHDSTADRDTRAGPDTPSSDSADSESDVVEDEDGELVTPAVEAQVLKTLAEIRARSGKIYDSKVQFFSPEELRTAETEWKSRKIAQKQKDRPMKLKDYHRERLLKGTTEAPDEDDDVDFSKAAITTHEEEQASILNAFKSAAIELTGKGDGDEDDGVLLKMRNKTEEEIVKEDEDYKKFLLENLATSENARESMSEWFGNKAGGGNGPDGEEQFLIEYILNRGWVDRDRKALPTYDQIVGDDDEDAEAVEQAEEFEEKYNFRFEQPGGDKVTTYARQIEGSLRREDSKRREHRLARKAKKEEEKEKQREELKRLKNLKRQEIEERIRKIQSISGTVSSKVNEIDLESDFDPEAHDRKMQQLFDDSYYQYEADETKPIYSSDSDQEQEEEHGLKSKVIQKATKAISKIVSKAAAASSGDDHESKGRSSLSKYMDEYYQLDYEDMIEDLPCRFKYSCVKPTTFGLKLTDIFEADDAELNAHVSLKKLAPYRSSEVQAEDEQKYASKKKLYKFYDLLKREKGGANKKNSKDKNGKKAKVSK